MDKEKIHSITFYKYFSMENPNEHREEYRELMLRHDIKGKIILAKEGINGAVAGKVEDCEKFLCELKKIPELKDITWRTTIAESEDCFKRTLVKIRPEIVPLGVEGITPDTAGGGKPLKPETLLEWYRKGEDFVVLDTRNKYEADAGTFKGAIIPDIARFRDFSKYVESIKDLKDKKIVTFCTGGVRCEKASAYMKSLGFENVYKLEGGVIEFMRIAGKNNFFSGKCFVFDKRETVDALHCALD